MLTEKRSDHHRAMRLGLYKRLVVILVLATCFMQIVHADDELGVTDDSILVPNALREITNIGRVVEPSTTAGATTPSTTTTTTTTTTSTTPTSAAQILSTSTASSRIDDIADDSENIPAHVTEPLSNEIVIVEEYMALNLCCRAEGMPKPSIQWTRNGKSLDSDVLWVDTHGCLRSDDFGRRENGLFQCTATNKFGTSLSQVITITFEVKANKSDVFASNEVFNVPAGTDKSLSCGNPPPTLPATFKRWYKDDKSEVKTNSRVYSDSTGTLHFAYVESEDQAAYQCGLVPSQDKAVLNIYLYPRGSLRVSGHSASAPDFPPTLQFATHDKKAVLKHDVTLECYFGGKPVPSVTWKNRSNHEIMAKAGRYSLEDYGRRLVIHNVVQADNGTYTCTATNIKQAKTETLHLTVIAPPMPVANKILIPTTVPDNSDVTLSCQTWTALGLTLNIPRWYRNGVLLNNANRPDPARYSFSDDHTQLTIRDLDKVVDTAAYQCNVTNSVGFLFMDGYLRVIESIEIMERPADVIVVDPEEHALLDLSVLAKGDHCCKIDFHWTVNDTSISFPSPPFIFEGANNNLYLNVSSVSETDLYSAMGMYKCRVSNLHQGMDVNFTLQMRKKATAVTSADSSRFELWWIAVIVGGVVLLIGGLLIFAGVKGYYPTSTYLLEKTELKHNLNPQEDLLNQSFQEI